MGHIVKIIFNSDHSMLLSTSIMDNISIKLVNLSIKKFCDQLCSGDTAEGVETGVGVVLSNMHCTPNNT